MSFWKNDWVDRQVVSPPRLIMGVINVTPDSFSDGGLYYILENAKLHAKKLILDGVDILDIGGESTRPGSRPVSVQEELDRTIPLVEWLGKNYSVRVSIDTQTFEVAKEAISFGATVINDVSGAADIRMRGLVSLPGIEIIVMHMKGSPTTMQDSPEYPNGVVQEVVQFLRARTEGLDPKKVWVDPGIGFGKTVEQNLELLRNLKSLGGIGSRIAIGTSRKSFLSKLSKGAKSPHERDAGTLASNLWALTQGVSVFRVHDVAATCQALDTWMAI